MISHPESDTRATAAARGRTMSVDVKPGYKQTEVGVIPEDWEVNSVGDMGEVRAGKALAVRSAGRQRPYLRTKNVFDGRIDLTDVLRMPMTDAEFSRYRLRHGDVLLNEGQSLELVGRCSIYKNEHRETCAIQNQLLRFRARDGASADFAAHLFRHCQQIGVFTRIALQTTSVAHLGVSQFSRLLQAWPAEEAEQEAIAEALSDAEALIESLEQLVAKKRQLKQGAMQELLTGKKRLPGFSGAWEVKQVSEFGEIVTGGTPRTDISAFWGEGYPWITPTDISTYRDMFISERTLTEKGLHAIRTLPANTVLVTCIASIGKNALLKVVGGCNQQINAVIPNKSNCAEFLYYLFETNAQYLLANAGTTATSIISKNTFKELIFRVPLLPEQTAIATILSDMDAEIAALEAKLAKARQIKQGMMQELLTGRIRLI